jgi:hypothetical protein
VSGLFTDGETTPTALNGAAKASENTAAAVALMEEEEAVAEAVLSPADLAASRLSTITEGAGNDELSQSQTSAHHMAVTNTSFAASAATSAWGMSSQRGDTSLGASVAGATPAMLPLSPTPSKTGGAAKSTGERKSGRCVERASERASEAAKRV